MNDATGTSARTRIEAVTLADSECGSRRDGGGLRGDGNGHHRSWFLGRLPRGRGRQRRRPRNGATSRTFACHAWPSAKGVALRGTRGRGAGHQAAGPLHRGVPGPAPGGARGRPAVHLREHHRDHPRPRLRLEEGDCARPVVHGVRSCRPAGGTTSPTWSTTGSRPRWRTTSMRSPLAARSRCPGSSASSSARTRRVECGRRGSLVAPWR